MKKNEYVAPEMEIVELTEQACLLNTSGGSLGDGNIKGDEDGEETPEGW